MDPEAVRQRVEPADPAYIKAVARFTQDVDLVAELPVELDELARFGERMAAAGLSAMEPDHFAQSVVKE